MPDSDNRTGKRMIHLLRRATSRSPGGDAAPRPGIDELRARKAEFDALVREELERRLHPNTLRQATDGDIALLEELLAFAEPRHLTHPMLRRIERNKLSLRSGLSFTSIMLEQSEAKRAGGFRPGWMLDNKARAYAFVDAIGVPRPRSDRVVRALADIEPGHPIVVKPVRATGSKGCYAVFSPEHIRHLRDGKEFSSWEQMHDHARWLMSQRRRRPVPDRWMVEELILEDVARQRPARDLKFYAFYGEVVLVRESRRVDGVHVRFWTPDGAPADTGHDREPDLADAVGVTAEQLKDIAAISEQIPVPFMRIDMLRGEHELVFGEFTPRPGHFDEFNDTWDRLLGEAWVRAEGHIISDVLAGKTFTAFATATRRLDS